MDVVFMAKSSVLMWVRMSVVIWDLNMFLVSLLRIMSIYGRL